jgi:hypothetical protein
MTQKEIAKELELSTDQISRIVAAASKANESLVDLGIDPNDLSHGWAKLDDFSLFFKNKNVDMDKNIRDYIEKAVEGIPSPVVEAMPPVKHSDPCLFIYQPSDVHFGKYAAAVETGEEGNRNLTATSLQRLTNQILQQVSNAYAIENQILVIGHDILHIDNPKRTTTSGTPQDTDGMWFEIIEDAVENIVLVIEKMKKISPVKVIFCPSNHDYTLGFCVAKVIEAHYRNDENVTGDYSISHRKYIAYGESLLGFTHGDGCKESDLTSIMAVEARDLWSDTSHGFWYLGHLHHKIAKDTIGSSVEYVRSPSPTDSWHHRNGYIGQVKGVEGFVHDKEIGQIARLTVSK